MDISKDKEHYGDVIGLLQNLGRKIAEYRCQKDELKRWFFSALSILIIVLSLIFVMLQAYNAFTVIPRHGRAILVNRTPTMLTFLIIGLLFAFAAYIYARINRHSEITLYENGLIYKRGKREQVWYWHDTTRFDIYVEKVKFGKNTIEEVLKILLDGKQGRNWVLKQGCDDLKSLTGHLQKNILPVLYEKANHRLNNGETLVFNKNLSAIRNGLELKNCFRHWGDIGGTQFEDGYFMIKCGLDYSKQFEYRVNQIRNLDLLLHLIENPPTSYTQTFYR